MEENTGNASLELAWNYESEDTLTRYTQLFNNHFLSDITFKLVSEDTSVPGHKSVLILCSWDFYNIFNLLKLDHYELLIEDVSLSSFLAFLEYCYTIKVNLTNETNNGCEKTLEILKLAQRFHMASLVRICEDHIKSKMTWKNCMMIFKNKDVISPDSAASNEMMNEIEKYFWRIIHDQSSLEIFVDLPFKDLYEIASDPLINCEEIEIFGVLMKWAKRNCEKKNIQSDSAKNLRVILRDVFYEIRFPSMQIYTFSKILAKYPGMFTQMEISNICSYICDGLHASSSSCMGFKCTPRFLGYPNESSDYIYSIIPFGLAVPYFSGVPKRNEETFEMTCKIEVSSPRMLMGFAFFVKICEMVNVLSFTLNYVGDKERKIEVIPSGRCSFNDEYEILMFRLKNAKNLIAYTYYQLRCLCDKRVPSLMGFSNHNIIVLSSESTDTIPYLIFDFNY